MAMASTEAIIEPVHSDPATGSQRKISIIQPIDIEAAAPIRTKLRILAILIALYVRPPTRLPQINPADFYSQSSSPSS